MSELRARTEDHLDGNSPRSIAAAALGVAAAEIVTVERIKHGLTNDSWRVRTASDAVIVRISNAAEALLQIDRRSEAAVLHLVAGAGLGPEVLVCDLARRVLVTRDLGSTWEEEDARLASNISRLGELLCHLHALPLATDVRRVDLVATLRGYLRALDERGHRSRLTDDATRARGEHAALALRQGSQDCLCHNDVHHLNIVGQGSLRLIDWEYSGIGEGMFDLASVCVYHRFDKRQRDRLLSSYLQRSHPDAIHRLDLACWLFEYVRELWVAVRESVGSEGV
jgi:thiamine kinase-like enzyme